MDTTYNVLHYTVVNSPENSNMLAFQKKTSEAQKNAKIAALSRSQQSIEQQAWQAFYSAQSAQETIQAAQESLDSSDKAAKVAIGRYDAGVGTMLEVLNAQSQLANSHQQWVAARYDGLVARTQLA